MRIRPAAVAGAFYPADPVRLREQVASLLADNPADGAAPKALICPHAGYIYSGPIAARAYRLLAPVAARIRRVVLLGPAHFVAVRGLATPDADAFVTPLGEIPLERATLDELRRLPQVEASRFAHAREHSLEVQLPFLQVLIPRFSLVPLVVGDASAEEVAEVLQWVWGGPETLIVISSDLSHYHAYGEAQAIDAGTDRKIVALQSGLTAEQACGCRPINGLLHRARELGMSARRVDLRNSGDMAGDKSRVVGYGAYAFAAE